MNYIISVMFTTAYVFVITPWVFLQPIAPEDSVLDFHSLARKYGYKSQDYNVTTEDGYILTLFRIPGNKSKPVLLMHGILDSADTFILRGRNSLASFLSQEYDVWIGNSRGNKYSRRHTHLDPNKDKAFWNFSFHEMAVFDLRTFVDFILNENSASRISLIGHSQGNTQFYVLGSVLPEYNAKIGVAIALGPICFLNAENYEFPFDLIFEVGPKAKWLFTNNVEEIFGENSLIIQFRNSVCTQRELGYKICAEGIFSLVGGEDLEELEPNFFYELMGHYPTSSSFKNPLHYLQLAMQKKFAQFDHGLTKNLEIYNFTIPPVYDLKKVTMNVALITGKNDKVTPHKNVEMLKNNLPNVVTYHVMEREKFNHVDHIWGKNMNRYLFPLIMKLLEEYS